MPAPSSHRALPIAAWPAADRKLWLDATAPCGPLDEVRRETGWAEVTEKGVEAAYGRWLGWVVRYDGAAMTLPAQMRVTPERIAEYQSWLSERVGDISVGFALLAIYRALRAMCEKADLHWLLRLSQQVDRRAAPGRDKAARMVHSAKLRDLGVEMMRANRPGRAAPSIDSLIKYRDGLLIAFLAVRPVRLSNIIEMRLGTNLLQRHPNWWLYWPSTDTKNGVEIDLPFPRDLRPFLETYLRRVRPPLLLMRANDKRASRNSKLVDSVWIAGTGGTMSKNALYSMTRTRTRERFGFAVNPNLFRDCLAWTLEQAGLGWTIPHMLGHTGHKTSEMYYNREWGERQQRLFCEHVASLRKSSKSVHGLRSKAKLLRAS